MKKLVYALLIFGAQFSYANICNYHLDVVSAITGELRKSSCADVTSKELEKITSLSVGNHYNTTNIIVYYNESSFPFLPNLHELSFMDNFPHLSGEVFKNLPALEALNFSWAEKTDLTAASAEGLNQLKSLNLMGQKLDRLPYEFIAGLSNLKSLDISANQLKEIPGNLPSTLESLRLDANPIKEVKKGTFLKLAQLKKMSLNTNTLEVVYANAFQGLVSLKKIEMIMWGCPESRCRTVFEDFAFQDLSSLSELTIGANPATVDRCSCDLIFKTNTFSGLHNLLTLNLKSVGSLDLDSALFKDLVSLVNIDLRYNRIQSLPSSIFSNQTNLRKLDLSSNWIKIIEPNAFRNLGQLKSLDLSNSGGPLKLNEETFSGLTSLEHLDLFYTGSILKGRVFKNLQTLKTLDISTNPITTEQREEIKQDLPNTLIRF